MVIEERLGQDSLRERKGWGEEGLGDEKMGRREGNVGGGVGGLHLEEEREERLGGKD